jgi:hypothetical protein
MSTLPSSPLYGSELNRLATWSYGNEELPAQSKPYARPRSDFRLQGKFPSKYISNCFNQQQQQKTKKKRKAPLKSKKRSNILLDAKHMDECKAAKRVKVDPILTLHVTSTQRQMYLCLSKHLFVPPFFFWSSLPNDIQATVCHFLKMVDFLQLSRVSKAVNALVASKLSQKHLAVSFRFGVLRTLPSFSDVKLFQHCADVSMSVTGMLPCLWSLLASHLKQLRNLTLCANYLTKPHVSLPYLDVLTLENVRFDCDNDDSYALLPSEKLVMRNCDLSPAIPLHMSQATHLIYQSSLRNNHGHYSAYPKQFVPRLRFLYLDLRSDNNSQTLLYHLCHSTMPTVERLVFASRESMCEIPNFTFDRCQKLRMLAFCSLSSDPGTKETENVEKFKGKLEAFPVLPTVTHLYLWAFVSAEAVFSFVVNKLPNLQHLVLPNYLRDEFDRLCLSMEEPHDTRWRKVLSNTPPCSLRQFLSMPLNQAEQEKPEDFDWMLNTIQRYKRDHYTLHYDCNEAI